MATVFFWALVAVLVLTSEALFVPLLPLIVTVIAIIRCRQWLAQKATPENNGSLGT